MLKNDGSKLNQLAALIAAQERTRVERIKVGASIEQLQIKERGLRAHETAIENQIRDVRILGRQIALPTSAPPSPKNLDFLRAWAALQSEFSKLDPANGLTQQACAAAIRRAVPGVAAATIRSHLHRLKNKGFISKRGANWHLAQTDGS